MRTNYRHNLQKIGKNKIKRLFQLGRVEECVTEKENSVFQN